MTACPPILQACNLTREVGSGGSRRAIVKDFSYSFRPGRIYSILGPSGAGKSSLLRLFNRLDEPTGGEVRFESADYRTYPPTRLRRWIGYLFQVPFLFPGTVADNLRIADPQLDNVAVDRLLELVSVKPWVREQSAQELSVGERQRVALARLLATRPKILLLDEPTAGLDPTYTERIETSIRQILAEAAVTIIMVSHSPRQAGRLGGEGLLLVAGRLVEQGPVEELIEQPRTEPGRRYRDKELT